MSRRRRRRDRYAVPVYCEHRKLGRELLERRHVANVWVIRDRDPGRPLTERIRVAIRGPNVGAESVAALLRDGADETRQGDSGTQLLCRTCRPPTDVSIGWETADALAAEWVESGVSSIDLEDLASSLDGQ